MCLVQLIEQPITNPEIMQQIICLFTFWVLIPSRYHNISTISRLGKFKFGLCKIGWAEQENINQKFCQIFVKNFVKYLSKISSNICQKLRQKKNVKKIVKNSVKKIHNKNWSKFVFTYVGISNKSSSSSELSSSSSLSSGA